MKHSASIRFIRPVLFAALTILLLGGLSACKRVTVSGTILSASKEQIVLLTDTPDTLHINMTRFKADHAPEGYVIGDQVEIVCTERANGLRAKDIQVTKPSFLRIFLKDKMNPADKDKTKADKK